MFRPIIQACLMLLAAFVVFWLTGMIMFLPMEAINIAWATADGTKGVGVIP